LVAKIGEESEEEERRSRRREKKLEKRKTNALMPLTRRSNGLQRSTQKTSRGLLVAIDFALGGSLFARLVPLVAVHFAAA